MEQPARRGHRRAVGPVGTQPAAPEPVSESDRGDSDDRRQPHDDDERFHADRPPHHDRER